MFGVSPSCPSGTNGIVIISCGPLTSHLPSGSLYTASSGLLIFVEPSGSLKNPLPGLTTTQPIHWISSPSLYDVLGTLLGSLASTVINSICCPPPLLQPSERVIEGVEVYPLPKLEKSIPMICPAAIIKLPCIPCPPPPSNEMLGGPQGNSDVLHAAPAGPEIPFEISFMIFDIPSLTSLDKLDPSQKLQRSLYSQSGVSSHFKKLRRP